MAAAGTNFYNRRLVTLTKGRLATGYFAKHNGRGPNCMMALLRIFA